MLYNLCAPKKASNDENVENVNRLVIYDSMVRLCYVARVVDIKFSILPRNDQGPS